MSEQITDPFFWNDEEWVFIAAEEVYDLFDPEKYGLNPTDISTDCWKGFIIQFSVKNNCLFFDNLWVNCDDKKYPSINGVKAKYIPYIIENSFFERIFMFLKSKYSKYSEYSGYHFYENISKRLYYSGTIVIGQGFMEEYHERAFTGPHMYERVYELVFENGELKSFSDKSGTYSGF